jgi:Domain of unknown function (DUF4397)
MRRFFLVAAATAALGVPVLTTPMVVASAQTATGMVTVVHGLRGVVADVYIDGQLALPAFQPERVTDPIPIAAGPHHVEVRLAGAPATDPPAAAADVNVTAGGRQSLVAHLDASGQPAITAFDDDVSAVPAGQARAVIRHTAAAPPIDVSLDGTVVAPNLAEPGSAEATVAAATYQVSVSSPGTQDAVIAPEPATLAEGSATVMYLIGSAQAGTLSWIAEQVPDLATPPTRIQTGDSGLAADPPITSGRAVPTEAILLGAGALIGATALLAARRRSHPV